MIALPLNDHQCLGSITQQMVERVSDNDEELTAIAARTPDTSALARWLRELPQRDDVGDPVDGPRVDDCEPSQRLRVPTDDPNCVERAALYLGVAELIDPGPVRQLATIDTPKGPHTIAVENGLPVMLDPTITRNTAEGGLFQLAEPTAIETRPSQAIDWLAALADEPAARHPRGRARVRCAREALHGMLSGRSPRASEADDIAFVLALAEREATLFGPHGIALARCTIRGLADLEPQLGLQRYSPPQRRNASLRIGGFRLSPDMRTIDALGRIGARVGGKIGLAALSYKLASLGISGPMLQEVERELNREGLSLGPLAKPPPMAGTLGALTPVGIAGRYLASRAG